MLTIDGDRIRLTGIDAPERKRTCGDWACGQYATGALESLTRGVELRCETEGRDRYGRDLAACWRGSIDVNAWMVERAFGLAYRKYSTRYVTQEEHARAHGRAIWRTKFQEPWLWRVQARQPSTDERIRDLQRQLDELKAQQRQQSTAPAQAPARACCKHCTKGIPCGNSCIAANKTCRQPPGCAC
jgi:hypothetical protein